MRRQVVTRGVVMILVALLIGSAALFACAAPKTTPAPAPAPTPTPAPKPAPTATPEKPIELKYQTGYPPAHAVSQAAKYWGDQLEKRTNNRVKLTYFFSETLGAVTTGLDMVLSGTVDLVHVAYAHKPGVFPLGEIFNYPVPFSSGAVAARVHWELFKKGYFDKELAGAKPLFLLTGTPQILMTSKPVRTLEDLKGMKIRAIGSQADFIARFGATAVTIPTADTYPALEKRVIDGTTTPHASAYALKLHEILKYILNVNVGSYSGVHPMNLQRWNSLPPDIQKVIDDLREEATVNVGKIYDTEGALALKAFAEAKVEIYTPPPTERQRFEALGQAAVKEWASKLEAKGLPANKLLQDLYALFDQYNK